MDPIADKIRAALLIAKEAEEAGDSDKSARAWQRAGELMARFAEESMSRETELRRLEKAKEYREQAERLRKGGGGEKKKQKSSRPKADAEEANEYQAMVAPLRFRSTVNWDEIGGLDQVRDEILLTYGIALAKKPEAVQIKSWKNILFYGPPGTGKTLLAAATSNTLGATFFNVKASNLLSKWFGESTKLISALYDTARSAADEGKVSVIFIDEFESLCPPRTSSEHGPEKRILSTLLAELDGLAEKREDRTVLTIAATNLPQEIDLAVLSRFQKRIYIPLPNETARKQILDIHLLKRGHKVEGGLGPIVEKTVGFSGRDLERLCTEAVGRMVQEANPDILKHVSKGVDEITNLTLKVRPLTAADFSRAMKKVKVDHEAVKSFLTMCEQFEKGN